MATAHECIQLNSGKINLIDSEDTVLRDSLFFFYEIYVIETLVLPLLAVHWQLP